MLCKLFEMNWAALLSQRFPFFILQVSHSMGASVFIGANIRKPTSKEGSRIYLTMGNLNRVWVKTEEMVPVRQQQAGTDSSLSSRAVRGETHLCWAPTVTVGQALAGIAQENTSVGRMNVTPNSPEWCGKRSCSQNWEMTRTRARLYRRVAAKKRLPSYKLFLLWVPAGKTEGRWWSWWSTDQTLYYRRFLL